MLYALQGKLKETLDKMAQYDIIADMDRPTEWVSNVAIKRENYMIPTPRDVQARLQGKEVFTVILACAAE